MSDRRNLENAISMLLAVVIGLTLVQIAGHPAVPRGYPAPLLCGLVVLSVLVRLLVATLTYVREKLPYVLRAGDVYVMAGVIGLLYLAVTNVGDASFGWLLAGALILHALWLFVLFAARNSAGDNGGDMARIQDWMTISALSGIATIVLWSLHLNGAARSWALGAVFAIAFVWEFWSGRNAEREIHTP
jgi:hypothetical protein